MKKKPDKIDALTLVKRELASVQMPVPHEGGKSQLDCVLRGLRFMIGETITVNDCLAADEDSQRRYSQSRMALLEGKTAEDLRRMRLDLSALKDMCDGIDTSLAIAELAARVGVSMEADDDDDDTFLPARET